MLRPIFFWTFPDKSQQKSLEKSSQLMRVQDHSPISARTPSSATPAPLCLWPTSSSTPSSANLSGCASGPGRPGPSPAGTASPMYYCTDKFRVIRKQSDHVDPNCKSFVKLERVMSGVFFESRCVGIYCTY